MAREIFALLDSDDALLGLVKSFSDPTEADPPPFYRSDLSRYRVHCLRRNPSPIGGPLIYGPLPASMKMAAGVIDAEPDAGTFTITDTNGATQTTGAIAYNASAATVQTAIRAALTTNFSAAIVTGENGGPWTIDRGAANAFTDNITGNSGGLVPSGSTVNITNTQDGTTLLNEKWQVRLRKAMPFLCTSFTAFAGVTTAGTLLQAGSATAGKAYTVTWNADAVGGSTLWSVSTTGSNNETIGPVAYNATEDEFKAALNKHTSLDGADLDKVSVKQTGPGSYVVTFSTTLANTPTIGATASSNTLVVPIGYEADIGTATAESDAILGTETEATITFEIEAREDSGKPRTIVRMPTKLYADLITSTPGQTTGVDNFLTESDLLGTIEAGIILFSDGEAAEPSISFADDTDTGFYRVAPNQIGVASNGALVATFSTDGLLLGAGLSAPISTKTDNYTATSADHTLLFNIATAKTLTLPAAASHSGRIYAVKNLSTSSDDLTIDPSGAELINGAASLGVIPGASNLIQCNGTGWFTLLTSS